MTLDEIRFVIQRPNGQFVLNTKKTERGWNRRHKVTYSTAPWPTWAAAQKANLRRVRREIDGKRRWVVESVGEIRAVRLAVVGL